jgi:Ca-activated chloride channel family protein
MTRFAISTLALVALSACHAQPEPGPMASPTEPNAPLSKPTTSSSPDTETTAAPAEERAEREADFDETSIVSAEPKAKREASGRVAQDPAPRPVPTGTAGIRDDAMLGGTATAATRSPAKSISSGEAAAARGPMPPPPAVAVAAPIAPMQPVMPDPVGAESYKDYGINGFTLAATDNQSTFAADVDTASYAITRSKLRGGYLPPHEAVRV